MPWSKFLGSYATPTPRLLAESPPTEQPTPTASARQEYAQFAGNSRNSIFRPLTRLWLHSLRESSGTVRTRGDEALAALSECWREKETRLGIELDPSVFAYTQRTYGNYDALVGQRAGVNIERQRIGAFASVLSARGWRARAEGLRAYSPFAEFAPPIDLHSNAFDRPRHPVSTQRNPVGERRSTITFVGTKSQCSLPRPDRRSHARYANSPSNQDTGSLLLHPIVIGIDKVARQIRATVLLTTESPRDRTQSTDLQERRTCINRRR